MTGFASRPPRPFPATTLPWVIAACAVVVYSLTLNPWISFGSVEQVARLSGWLWEPNLNGPAYFLLTLPIRMLPESWIPAALNVLSAVCAAATLGLLARTVAILPHNRTHEQRIRCGVEGEPLSFRTAWLPPVLAAAVCGMQLTFWENATAGTPHMLNLLLFAYVIRCLLEFRLDGRHFWLWQTAVVTGALMANSGMLGFLPAYLVALIWLKRFSFFNGRFLGRMTLWGLLGLSLYLLLPLLQSQNADVPVGFWQSLKYTLASQKHLITSFLRGMPFQTKLLLSLTSLVPVLLISIRWPQSFGDLSPQGARFATVIFHVVHAVLLLTCIWIAFDPQVSPRHAGRGLPFLTLYYLAAIAIGYFAGYFLLVFGTHGEAPTYTYGRRRRSPLNHAVVIAVALLPLIAIAGLTLRNLPHIQMTNSSALRDYASLIADNIPEGDTVVLSDDSVRELVLRSVLTQRGDRPNALLLNTGSLVWPQYHQKLAAEHPVRWPVEPLTNLQARVPERALANLMVRFSQSNQICYAHPSFGYYFEYFQSRPAGILNLLTPYPTGELLPQPLSPEVMELNERFWDQSAARLLKTVEAGIDLGRSAGPAEARNPLAKKLYLKDEPNATAELLGSWLSRSLNSYGVELQRAGFLEQAAQRFTQAVKFNPDNVAASVNLRFNADLQAGRPSSVTMTKSLEDRFKDYRGTPDQILQQAINANGLFDEPHFTMTLAELLMKGRLFRQSAIEFNRVRQLLPSDPAPQLLYARLVSLMGDPDQALSVVEDVRREPERFELTNNGELQLMFAEATAFLGKQEPSNAVAAVEKAIAAAPDNTNLVSAAIQLYIRARLFTNSLDLINRELVRRPDDVDLLVNKGFVLLRSSNQEPAVVALSRALELQSNSAPARLNRAIANLQLDNLEAAQADYEELLLRFPNSHPIYYGLGEIAFRSHNTNQAVYYYRLYLSNAPPRTAEARNVRQRLESLSGATP